MSDKRFKIKEPRKMKYFIPILIFLSILQTGKSQNILSKNIGPFDNISIFGSIDATIEKSENDSIFIDSDFVDMDKVSIKTEDKTLKISTTEKLFDNRKQFKIVIKYRELKKIKINGGAEITGKDEITEKTVELIAGSGATITIKVNSDFVDATVGQGATIRLGGTCRKQRVETSTGGIYSAYELKCDSGYLKANTGGIVKAFANSLLDAVASTGGQISYRGDPKIKKEKTILGGNIEKMAE
jgi:hypothetical protein